MEEQRLNVLVVEDDPLVAATLRWMIELAGDYRVVGIAEDLEATIVAVRSGNVHLALVDIQLANLDSGFRVAAELGRCGISCILMSGKAPPFPMPELAVTCIEKPVTVAAVAEALATASAHLFRAAGEIMSSPSIPTPDRE